MKIDYIGRCLVVESKEGKKILVIGDLHFGYGESMRRSGIMIPDKIYEEVLDEMNAIFVRAGRIDEVVLLGDLKHEFGKILDAEWREIKKFIDYLKGKIGKAGKIIIIKGNHDKITEVVTEQKDLELKDYYIFNDVAFVHGDKKLEGSDIYNKDIKYWIMGHGHPAVKISDGVKEEKYKCFLVGKWRGREIVIVPSFFDVNEGTDARDFDLGLAWDFNLFEFRAKVIAELIVLDFGKLKEI